MKTRSVSIVHPLPALAVTSATVAEIDVKEITGLLVDTDS